MKPVRYSACAWLVAAALGGCAGGEVESGATVRVTSPELVAVSPGVQVVSDADEPLFYADSYYWLYRDGVWLRSDSYRGGFARIDVNMVPGEVRDIPQPQIYAHYRHHGGAYARGAQIRERAPSQPQGTYQQQQAQPQPPQQPYQQQRPMQPGTTPTEPQPSSPTQTAPVPNPMPPNQGTPGAGTSGSPNTQGSQIPQNTPPALPSQRDRDAKDLDRDHDSTTQPTSPTSPTSPATTPTDRGKDKDKAKASDKDKDKSRANKSSTIDDTSNTTDKDKARSDVDKNRSDLDSNKSGMDDTGMDREHNDAKDNNKKARGSDSNKKDKSDKDKVKDY